MDKVGRVLQSAIGIVAGLLVLGHALMHSARLSCESNSCPYGLAGFLLQLCTCVLRKCNINHSLLLYIDSSLPSAPVILSPLSAPLPSPPPPVNLVVLHQLAAAEWLQQQTDASFSPHPSFSLPVAATAAAFTSPSGTRYLALSTATEQVLYRETVFTPEVTDYISE